MLVIAKLLPDQVDTLFEGSLAHNDVMDNELEVLVLGKAFIFVP